VNTDRDLAAWGEAPATPDEEVLASFLSSVLDRLSRGEVVQAGGFLDGPPEVVERGEQLVRDVQALCGAALSVWEHSGLLRGGATLSDPNTPLPDPFPGEFRFVRLLGRGAFGLVWLADDLHLGRPVAVKTIRSSAISGAREKALRALRNEARLLAALRHPHLVPVHAWREAGGEHYLVMEYLSGGSLDDRLEREGGPMPWQVAARYLADVAEALLEVHARGVVHRDVKPANILWDPVKDEALLTDFGVSARLTDPGNVAGTPHYMAPEAVRGEVTPAVDVYALAASLFKLVTGAVPFSATTSAELIRRVEQGLPDPDRRCACLPLALERILRAGLSADPGRRPDLPAFAGELRAALNLLLADTLTLPHPGPPRPAHVNLRLALSRQVGLDTFVPVATTSRGPERMLRDLKRVPPAPGQASLQSGDRVRLEVEADRSGFLTVFNVGPTGNLNLLFPAGAVAGPLQARRPLHVLDVELSPPAGRERLFALWSREPLPLRLDELLALAEQGEAPASGPYRATRDMIRLQESVRRLAPEDWHAVVLELDHR
jgi:serine/threonine protein kinase